MLNKIVYLAFLPIVYSLIASLTIVKPSIWYVPVTLTITNDEDIRVYLTEYSINIILQDVDNNIVEFDNNKLQNWLMRGAIYLLTFSYSEKDFSQNGCFSTNDTTEPYIKANQTIKYGGGITLHGKGFDIATATKSLTVNFIGSDDDDGADPISQQPLSVASKSNYIMYWGQGYNSVKKGGGDKPLKTYCDNDIINVIQISFLYLTKLPYIDMKLCPDGINCEEIGYDILYCQNRGKHIGLSYGGATGQMNYTSKSNAEAFAVKIWNMFYGGTPDKSTQEHRPFGLVKLDGMDFDLETIFSYQGDFARKLYSLALQDKSKSYWFSAAPQCPFADRSLGPDGLSWDRIKIQNTVLSAIPMTFISVQFYNNYCKIGSNQALLDTFKQWHDWTFKSLNPNCRVMMGYKSLDKISVSTLKATILQISDNKNFGGMMEWQAQNSVVWPEMGLFLKTL